MINYTITRTQETTKITLPEGTIKYHNKLNNTSYYTNKAEQRIRTHQRSWKTIATVYLDNITLNTETITTDTVFTFHLKNTTNNTSIDIPVNNKLADFQTNITNELNPKHFYIVDLDNTSRFQTHFLDFINTVLIELNTNSTVLNELIEDTPVEEPTTPDTVEGLLPYITQNTEGTLTIGTHTIIPVLLDTTLYMRGQDGPNYQQYTILLKDSTTQQILQASSFLRNNDIEFISGPKRYILAEPENQEDATIGSNDNTSLLISFKTDNRGDMPNITFKIIENEETTSTCTLTINQA